MKNKILTPVLLFAYNRPLHLKKTLNALKNNYLASDTLLIINCDGKKNRFDYGVDEVSKICKSIKGFKSIKIIKNKKNNGLAKSIVNTLSREIKKHKKLIILEDDIVTSKSFLIFMNSALNYYKKNKNVWHISGHSLFHLNKKKLNSIYFSQYMNCWGWATWEDRWCYFKKNPDEIFDITNKNKKIKKKFQIHKYTGFYEQIIGNINGNLNTWAIFWYWQIFYNNKFCINPNLTLTKNIGQDGSGIHKDYNLNFQK